MAECLGAGDDLMWAMEEMGEEMDYSAPGALDELRDQRERDGYEAGAGEEAEDAMMMMAMIADDAVCSKEDFMTAHTMGEFESTEEIMLAGGIGENCVKCVVETEAEHGRRLQFRRRLDGHHVLENCFGIDMEAMMGPMDDHDDHDDHDEHDSGLDEE